MRWELLVGLRYLRARRREIFVSLISLIAGLGVAIGVMVLCIVMAVMTGFEEDLRARILGFNPPVVLLSYGTFGDYDTVADRVREVPGVTAAQPFVYGQAMIAGGDAYAGAIVRGVPPDRVNDIVDVGSRITRGGVEGLGQSRAVEVVIDGKPEEIEVPGVVLGFELARAIGVDIGDWVNLMNPLGSGTAVGMVPRIKRYAVVGIFDAGMFEYDNSVVFMALGDAQSFFRLGDKATGVEARVAVAEEAKAVGEALEMKLGYPFYARDWMEVNRNLFVAFQLEKTIQFLVLMLIVLVAAFNIAATLIMVVMEKRKDIAILKSMGATNGAIAWIFVLMGGAIGFVGTVLGVAGGVGGSLLLSKYQFIKLPENVFYVSTVPVQIEPANVAAVAVVSVAICVLATVYPARQAARLAPVEVIRYE